MAMLMLCSWPWLAAKQREEGSTCAVGPARGDVLGRWTCRPTETKETCKIEIGKAKPLRQGTEREKRILFFLFEHGFK
jgi:hypothetical protein